MRERLRVIHKALEDCGYFLFTQVMDAWEYGVPQRRRRLVIVGSKYPGFEFPEPLPVAERRTLRDAIGDLPLPTTNGDVFVDGRVVSGHKALNHSEALVELVAQIPEGG